LQCPVLAPKGATHEVGPFCGASDTTLIGLRGAICVIGLSKMRRAISTGMTLYSSPMFKLAKKMAGWQARKAERQLQNGNAPFREAFPFCGAGAGRVGLYCWTFHATRRRRTCVLVTNIRPDFI